MRLPVNRSLGIAAVAIVLSVGCSSRESNTTTGKRIVLQTVLTAGDDARAPFTNAYGWSMSLTKIAVSTGPLYYFSGSPLFARVSPSLFERFVGIRVAHAHPGHYQEGTALGQMLEPSSADLMLGDAILANGAGITGTFRSARFTWSAPPTGPASGELGPHVVVLEGTGTKGGVSKIFRATADIADTYDIDDKPIVEGCGFTEADVEGNGMVTVRVKPSVWLDQVELDDVPSSTDGKPVTMPRDGRAFKEFARALKDGGAFVFSYSR
jgi:hypothetical protein